jgi:hypothetical protein
MTEAQRNASFAATLAWILYVQPFTLRHIASSVDAVNRLVPIFYTSLFRFILCGGGERDLDSSVLVLVDTGRY